MRFEDLLARHERGELTQEEVGELLGMSGRTFRRWRERYREEGSAGLADRRVGETTTLFFKRVSRIWIGVNKIG